jgi:hypothetical protein
VWLPRSSNSLRPGTRHCGAQGKPRHAAWTAHAFQGTDFDSVRFSDRATDSPRNAPFPSSDGTPIITIEPALAP